MALAPLKEPVQSCRTIRRLVHIIDYRAIWGLGESTRWLECLLGNKRRLIEKPSFHLHRLAVNLNVQRRSVVILDISHM